MNCLPVVEMEMRSASRRKSTFGLRILFAIAGSAASLIMVALPGLSRTERGRIMLVILSYLSLAFCLFAGGFLTADCVSSEKREGTLGLLFLTPLRGMDIVLGKLVCHGLQMFYGVAAVFPLFFFPLLTGGVTWGEVSRVAIVLAASLFLAASVGMFVSVLGTESSKTIMATFATVVLLTAVPMVYLLARRTFSTLSTSGFGLPQLSPVFTVFLGFDFNYRRPDGPAVFWGSLIALLVLSALLLAAAGALLGRVFQSLGTSGTRFRKQSGEIARVSVLDGNPYEWVILRRSVEPHPLGVLIRIFLSLFAMALLASLLTNHWQAGFITAFFTALALHIIAKLRFAVEATRQIQADQQSGALELVLVTTLTEQSILQGHRRALQKLSHSTLFLLIGLNLVLELCVLLFQDGLHIDLFAMVMFTSLFLGGIALAAADFSALRWLALLQGLRASNHVKAASLTFCVTMILPWIGMGLTIALVTSIQPSQTSFATMFWLWIVLCLLYDLLLIRYASGRLHGGLRRLASEGI